MVNGIGCEALMSPFRFWDVQLKVSQHCKKVWNRWRASFVHMYPLDYRHPTHCQTIANNLHNCPILHPEAKILGGALGDQGWQGGLSPPPPLLASTPDSTSVQVDIKYDGCLFLCRHHMGSIRFQACCRLLRLFTLKHTASDIFTKYGGSLMICSAVIDLLSCISTPSIIFYWVYHDFSFLTICWARGTF